MGFLPGKGWGGERSEAGSSFWSRVIPSSNSCEKSKTPIIFDGGKPGESPNIIKITGTYVFK